MQEQTQFRQAEEYFQNEFSVQKLNRKEKIFYKEPLPKL